jgi:hypothetical protein
MSTHETTALTSASLVFGQELKLPYDLLFAAPPEKERLTTDYEANLVDHLLNIQNYARQHLKLASGRMKTRYNRLANCAGYHECDKSVALSSNPHEGEIAQAPNLMGRPIQGSHLDK